MTNTAKWAGNFTTFYNPYLKISSIINQIIFRYLLSQVPVYQIKYVYCEKILVSSSRPTESWVMDETYSLELS